MASSIQLLRSTIAQERPFPGNLLEGQPAVNLNSSEPGLFFKAADGSLVKFGPAAITSDGSPPNSSPQGSSGNTVGELWLDKSTDPAVLKVYDGTDWIDAGSGGGGGGSASFIRWIYTAAGGETSLSGTSGGVLLEYTAGLEEVFINGVLITRGTDYSAINGTSITNLAPLAAGDVVTVTSISPLETVQLPGQVTLLRWTILAEGGQTVLSGVDSFSKELAYTTGFEEVYVNGAFLRRGIDYTATNGFLITLATPLALDDEVTVMAWSTFQVGALEIDTNDIVNGAVTEDKLDSNSVSSDKIIDGSITDTEVSSLAENRIDSSKVKYQPFGTGAQPISVQDKLEDVISVLDYGADRTGATDSSAAIQAAINAAGNSKRVYIPGGKYLIQETLTLKIGSSIFGDPGGVAEESITGFSEGTVLYLSTTKPNGTSWTTSVINPLGQSYPGRVLFCGSPSGGACVMKDFLAYSLGANANNSTFMYCGGTESSAPYERGFVTQYHGTGLRLFAFNRGWSGSRFDDAWLTDCHSELVTSTFVGTAGPASGWNAHMVNCLWWRSSVHFSMAANLGVNITATNCVLSANNPAIDQVIATAASGSSQHNYNFSNCSINSRFFLRDISNLGGDTRITLNGCRLFSSSFTLVEEGATRLTLLSITNCLINDFPININYKGLTYVIQGNTFSGSTSKITMKGASNTIIANNNWDLCTTPSPLVDFEAGVISNDVLISGNLFNSLTSVGGSSFRANGQQRVKLSNNRYLPDEEVNFAAPWSPPGIFRVLGQTVVGDSITDAEQYFVLRNTSGTIEDVRLLAEVIGDSASTLEVQTAVSDSVATRLKITESGDTVPGQNNVYNLGSSSSRWKEVYATEPVINTSDERVKLDIKESSLGLDFVKKLFPIQYRAKEGKVSVSSEQVTEGVYDVNGELITPPEFKQVITHRPGERIHFGLSAQQVKSVIPNGLDFAGWVLEDPRDESSLQSLRYTEFISILVKAIQELEAKVTELSNKP